MKIHIVSGLVDTPAEQSTATLSAHVNEGIARSAADIGRYAVVETVELDLTGLMSGDAIDCAEAAGYCEIG
jgi:hypothetical protein